MKIFDKLYFLLANAIVLGTVAIMEHGVRTGSMLPIVLLPAWYGVFVVGPVTLLRTVLLLRSPTAPRLLKAGYTGSIITSVAMMLGPFVGLLFALMFGLAISILPIMVCGWLYVFSLIVARLMTH